MEPPQTTSNARSGRVKDPPPPHLELQKQLDALRTCYADVHAIQDRVFGASLTAKTNDMHWTKLQSEARLAVIRTRRIRTDAMKTFREVHEHLRRGLYTDPDTKTRAEGLTITASTFFDKLHREGF